jgi:hypothetical protein
VCRSRRAMTSTLMMAKYVSRLLLVTYDELLRRSEAGYLVVAFSTASPSRRLRGTSSRNPCQRLLT